MTELPDAFLWPAASGAPGVAQGREGSGFPADGWLGEFLVLDDVVATIDAVAPHLGGLGEGLSAIPGWLDSPVDGDMSLWVDLAGEGNSQSALGPAATDFGLGAARSGPFVRLGGEDGEDFSFHRYSPEGVEVRADGADPRPLSVLSPVASGLAQDASAAWRGEATASAAVAVKAVGSDAPVYLVGDFGAADTTVSPATNASSPLINIDDFRSDPAYAGIDGSGYASVILDTGIDLNHSFFGPDGNGDGVADRIVYQYDFANGDANASDVNGHGSNVASIIGSQDSTYKGMAPGADLIALKVFTDAGTGYFSYIENALRWVVNNAAAYNIVSVNMSLSDSGNYGSAVQLYGLADELAALAAQGVIVVSAAGNDFYRFNSVMGVAYPAADPNSLAVGAVYDGNTGGWSYSSGATAYSTAADAITPFSQRDDQLSDIFAPGAPITGANAYGGTVAMHGTSQAAPHIAGIAVLAQQLAVETLGRKLTVTEFKDLLSSTGVSIVDGDDENDNVANTGETFKRVDVKALGDAIVAMAAPELSIEALDADKAEGGAGSTDFTFTVTRSGPTSVATTVDYAVSGKDVKVYSGTLAHESSDLAGYHQHYFVAATETLQVGAGDTLFSYVYLDPATVPSRLMLQWNDGTWDHRAYWGANWDVPVNGTAAAYHMGALPTTGEWVRLEVPASIVDLEGSTVTGMSFALWDGAALWDRAGVSDGSGETVWVDDAMPAGAIPKGTFEDWSWVSGAEADAADFAGGVLPSGTVSFAAGETSKTITVAVDGDTSLEPDEGFAVTLSNASGGAQITTAEATGRIQNDDAGGVPVGSALVISALDAVKAEGASGSTAFTFTVTRSGDTSGAATVDYAVSGSGGNAADGADFTGGTLPSGTVNFAAGEASKTLTVLVAGDGTVETDEGFTVTLSNPSSGTITTETADGTIQNDDVLPGQLSIAALDAVKAEGASGSTDFTFTVTRSGNTSGSATADYGISGIGGNPADGTDFTGGTLPSGTVSFADGEASKTLTVLVAGDATVETDEGFRVTLSNPSSGTTISTATADGTIQNDDAPPGQLSITVLDAVKAEGASGSTAFTFTVTRSVNTSGAATADYSVSGIGANAADGADFAGGTLPSGTVSFADGEVSKTLTVLVAGDGTVETDEGFRVTLSNPSSGTTISTATADGTIQNDDAPPGQLSIAPLDAVKAEGASGSTAFTFTVSRSVNTSGAAAVDYAVTGIGGNPADGTDFTGATLPSGTVNFADGESSKTLTVLVAGDGAFETDEGFRVTLSNASSGTIISTATADGTIQNDDAPPAELSIAPLDAVKAEGASGSTAFTFTVTRSVDTSGAATVDYAVSGSGGNAADGADFTGGILPSGTVSFADGEASKTLTVLVAGDAAIETDEGFTVTLSNPSSGAVISTATADGSIQNDDVPAIPTELSIAPLDAVKAEGTFGTTDFTFTVTRSGDTSGANTVDFAVTGVGSANVFSGTSAHESSDLAGYHQHYFVAATETLQVGAGDTLFAYVYLDPAALPSRLMLQWNDGTWNHRAYWGDNWDVPVNGTAAAYNMGALPTTGEWVRLEVPASIVDLEGSTLTGMSFALWDGAAVWDRAGVSDGGDETVWVDDAMPDGAIPKGTNEGWSWVGGAAADASDFDGGSLPSGTVTFAAGETSKTITVSVAGDTDLEPEEAFAVTLSNASGGALITTAAANATIQDDDAAGGPVGSALVISALDAAKAEGASGSTGFTFTVTRFGNISGAATADYAVSGIGGNPADGTDFAGGSLPSGTVSFAAGEASKTLTVLVAGDGTLETDEGFRVTLSNPSSGTTLSTATADGTIQNDDAPPGQLSIAVLDAVKAEGASGSTAFTFTVTRSVNTSGAATADYAVSGIGVNAANGTDFAGGTLPSGTVSFADGETSKTLTVLVAGDGTVETDEGFRVTLSNPSSGTTISTATADGTIQNDDAPPGQLSIAPLDAVKAEGASGSTAFTFTVSRSVNTSGAAVVDYAVTGIGGNPADGIDFAGATLPSGTVNFADGESSKTLTVLVAGDGAFETDEGFRVTLSNASSGTIISTATADGTIQNDDAPPAELSIAPLDAVKAEGASGSTAFTFTVTRSVDTSGAATVDYAVSGSGGNAADGADFTGGILPSGTVSFADGESSKTLTVLVAGDAAIETDEGFTVTLSNPSSGAVISTATADGTIQNDDVPAIPTELSIAPLDAVKAEGTSGTTDFTFTVTRSGDTSGANTVDFAVTGVGSANVFSGTSAHESSDLAGYHQHYFVAATETLQVAAGDTLFAYVYLDPAALPSRLMLQWNDGTWNHRAYWGDNWDVPVNGTAAAYNMGALPTTGEWVRLEVPASLVDLQGSTLTGMSFALWDGAALWDRAGVSNGSGETVWVDDAMPTGAIPKGTFEGWNWISGAAADASDFDGGSLPSGTVTFAAGETSKTITFSVAGDTDLEPEEVFAVTLSNASGGALITTAAANGTIEDDDAPDVSAANLAAGVDQNDLWIG